MVLVRILIALTGAAVVLKTLFSAVQIFVLPRAVSDPLARTVFLAMRALFEFRTRKLRTYAERDRVMALYAPVSLLSLPIVSMALVLAGYGAIFWALGPQDVSWAVTASGSSLLTLGFASLGSLPQQIVAFTEATIGLGLVALLIAYLPTMYATWSRREQAVAILETRAGSPPSAVNLILRYHRLDHLDRIAEIWPQWEAWFIDVEETHTSLAALTFFRSPQPDRSWITAAGAVLDAAALFNAALDVPRDVQADLTLRSGYIALRRIAALFRIPFQDDPHYPEDPISVSREEFDTAYERLEEVGVPLKCDRDAAWQAFAGWRVTYDAPLISLARLTMAPAAPWSSDR